MPSNLELLEDAASKLGTLLNEVVFVGGSTLSLLITDEAAAPVRSSVDVDVIAEIATQGDNIVFSERLRGLWFSEDTREGAPICRWRHGELTLDVMPVDRSVLGFSNIWYRGAMDTAAPATLPSGAVIRVVTAPYFLGTKMEAFLGRGKRDYLASHDLEDFIAVIEGRPSMLEEVSVAAPDLRMYLAHVVFELLSQERFRDALPGYLPSDTISQQRVPLVLKRLTALSGMGR